VAHGPEPPDRPRPPAPLEATQRWRLTVRREPIDPAAAGRAQQPAWEHALIRSGLPVAGLDAPAAKPRFAMAAPLGAAILGEAELVDVWLTERLPRWRVREALAGIMPPGFTLVDLHDVWLGEGALPGQVIGSVYRFSLDLSPPELDRVADAIGAVLAAETLPRRRVKGERSIDYDLRPMIDELAVRAGGPGSAQPELVMTLRHDPEKGVGRPEEVLAELGDRVGRTVPAGHLTRERLVLAADRPTR
jgi:hypothetical protein